MQSAKQGSVITCVSILLFMSSALLATDQTAWSQVLRTSLDDTAEVLTDPPQLDTVIEGSTASFTITATGAEPLAYQWQYNKSGWANISGATSATYSFTANINDNNTPYRCWVSNAFGKDTSSFVLLTVLSEPTINAPPMNDTVVSQGDTLSFGQAMATGNPPPGFEWFFMQTLGSVPVSVGTSDNYSLTGAQQTDEGYYFFIATNTASSVSSDTAMVDVYANPLITKNLDSTKLLLENSNAHLQIDVTGDGTLQYQWYKNGRVLSGESKDSLFLGAVSVAAHNDTSYSCHVWSSTPTVDTVGGVVASVICTLKVGRFSNPFELTARRVDEHNTTQVILTISSTQSLTDFPSTLELNTPWAEHVYIPYQTKNYPADITDTMALLKYATETIKLDADNVITDTITVEPFPPDNDLHYYFSNTILWHDPPGNPDTLFPLVDAPHNKVFLGDTVSPDNNLTISGEYTAGTDLAKITVSSTTSLSDTWDSAAVFECSDYSDFSSILSNASITLAILKSGGDTYSFNMKIGNAPFETKTVYSRCRVVGKNTATSINRETSFTAGQARPVYGGTLDAKPTSLSDAVEVSWTLPDPGTDSVRIWFCTDSIPIGEYSIPLTQDDVHGVASTAMVIDSIKNLNSKTNYYFSLQILRDGLWSRTTESASDTATTSAPDLALKVPNAITIDTTWFDTSKNAMTITWTVDTSIIPPGATLQYGYTYSILPDSSYKDTTTSPFWSDAAGAGGTCSVPLGNDIVFDTTYMIGMWLRAKNVSATGPSAPPGDSVAAPVTIPSFTWQPIVFTKGTVDTAYAANQTIILQGIVPFDLIDTLHSFKPGSLPPGFVDVGGTTFIFKNTNPQIPDIILGLKYGILPPGITENAVGLYQLVNDNLRVRHGFTRSNGAVWDILTNTDMSYPFLVLADTVVPVISMDTLIDTVSSGTQLPVEFTVNDNSINTLWRLIYGRGYEGYTASQEKFLTDTVGSFNPVIKDTNNLVNESFGLRALVIASDGVNADTVNVSKCVRTDQTEAISVLTHEWVPLRATGGLKDRELSTVFEASINDGTPWKYDTHDYRLYRWYNPSPDSANSWLEYSSDAADAFSFIPGRCIWFKSRESMTISFGEGVTTTLKEPYRTTLKSKNWTDICLPFQFSVLLRDILESTGAASDSLEVYYWKKDEKIYEAVELYIASLDDIQNVTDTILSQQKYDGYTVYNHSNTAATLLIPPISLALSDNHNTGKIRNEPNPAAWNIHFKWTRCDNGIDSFYRRVRCGYEKGTQPAVYGIMPPTMSSLSVGVVDTRNSSVHGWALQHTLENNKGVTFDLLLNNTAKEKAEIKYFLANQQMLPDNYSTKVLNISKKKYEECTIDNVSTITLKPEEKAKLALVIGSGGYFSDVIARLLTMKLLKAFPNPFNGRVKIHYRLPLNIREVNFALYNLQGKTMWKGVDRRNVTSGEHVFYFNGKTGSGKTLSAGVYILRMTAKNSAGRTVYGGQRRITCVK